MTIEKDPKVVIVNDSQGNNVAGGAPTSDGGIPDDLQYIADNRGGDAIIVDLGESDPPPAQPSQQ